MKKHYFGKLFSAIITAFTLAFITTSPVIAAETPDYRLQVSPSYAEIEKMVPGRNYEGVFMVQNTGSKEFEYAINVTPYGVSDDQYTIDSDTETAYTQIKDWVSLSKNSGTLGPDSSEEIKYTIRVPSDAPGGGQYALINIRIVQDSDSTSGAAITATKQIGFRLLGDIDGDTKRAGKVVEQSIPTILFNPPITANSTVENTGNIHVKASYVLQVFPLFSNEEVYSNEDSPQEVTILPETSRYNSITWDGAPHLGIFRVKQTVTIADDVQTIEKTVFLCPIWFIFIILLIIFCIIFWIFSRVKSRRER